MQKLNVVLSLSAIIAIAMTTCQTNAVAQGFGGYVAPQTNTTSASSGTVSRETASTAQQVEPKSRDTVVPTQQSEVSVPLSQSQDVSKSQTEQDAAPQGGYLGEGIQNAIAPPPKDYNLTEEEQKKLNEFLARWEEFGKGIKRVSCDVHAREFDGVMQQNNKRPVAHTWGQFRFISPNKLSYHIKGEFVYTDATPKGEWKESQNEWKLVLDGKALTQYDFKNKKVIVFPIVDEEQDMDLTMDNGQFPLFFRARADILKERFYLRLVTPSDKVKSEVWLEAYPRYTRDAQQFQSIIVILGLKDLQPTYMRKIGVNGKSKTDLTFENLSVNKGLWKIEGNSDPGWTKEVREERFSILRQQPMEIQETALATTVPTKGNVSASKDTASEKRVKASQTVERQARSTSSVSKAKGMNRY